MYLECGNLTPKFLEAGSIEDALKAAGLGRGTAWIGALEPSDKELAQLGQALGAKSNFLVEIEERGTGSEPSRERIKSQLSRSCAEILDGIVHVLVRGPTRESSGELTLNGDIELFATTSAIIVATRGVTSEYQAKALLSQLSKSLDPNQVPTAAMIVVQVISQVFDWYEDLLDEVEQEIAIIADELFGDRREELLPRLYALARPLHGATVAVQPFARGLDRVLGELDGGSNSVAQIDWRNDAEHLATRVTRLDALLVSTLQVYLGRSQDEANALADKRNDITQRMSAYALLLAIPTIIFSIYGTNFQDIWVLHHKWGYPVIMAFTAILCLVAYLRLRRAGWL